MKVLIVSPAAYPFRGGVEKHVHELSRSLQAEGVQVRVVSHKLKTETEDMKNIEGVEYVYFNIPFGNFYFVSSKLVKYVKAHANDYDVIHLQALHKPLAIYLLAKLGKTSKKVFLTPHYHGGGHTSFAEFAHKFYRVAVRMFIKKVNKVIAVSDGEAELLRRDFPAITNKIEIIPNGIVKPDKQPAFNKTKPTLITVSRLEPYKRIDLIIKNLPKDMSLVVVGSGDDTERLKQISFGKDVVFTGNISDKELNQWWYTADLFISLSEKEAYGLTFGEAMSIGLPCIVSDIPAHRFVHNLFGSPQNVVFYEPKQDFMRQYKRAVADKPNGSKAIVFTWDKAARELIKIYKEYNG